MVQSASFHLQVAWNETIKRNGASSALFRESSKRNWSLRLHTSPSTPASSFERASTTNNSTPFVHISLHCFSAYSVCLDCHRRYQHARHLQLLDSPILKALRALVGAHSITNSDVHFALLDKSHGPQGTPKNQLWYV